MGWFSDIIKAPIKHAKQIVKGIKKDPVRALIGANTEFETDVWNSVLGTDYEPLVSNTGGATDKQRAEMEAEGINTGAYDIADSVALAYAGNYAGGAAGGAASGGTGGAAGGTAGGGGLSGILGGGSAGYVGAGLSVLDMYNTQNAIRDQQQAIEGGFEQQNPWSKYQPIMGANLMQLLSDPSQIENTPGFKFARDQGLQGLFSKQASAGNRFSGRAITEAMEYGQGLAAQMWNQEANRYAQLAGATQPVTGGITTGQNQAALIDQQSTNQGYFLNNLLSNIGRNRSTSTNVAPQVWNTPDSGR